MVKLNNLLGYGWKVLDAPHKRVASAVSQLNCNNAFGTLGLSVKLTNVCHPIPGLMLVRMRVLVGTGRLYSNFAEITNLFAVAFVSTLLDNSFI